MDINALKNKLNNLQNTTSKQNNLWKPQPGSTQIRIVPYKFNTENPFIELYFHFELGKRSYLSPTTFGQPDPIVEFSEKLKRTGNSDDWKLARKLEPKMRTFAPIVVRGEEKMGCKFWGFGKTVYQELLGFITDPDYGDITDPVDGRDVVVEFQTAEEAGRNFPVTKIRVKPSQTPLTDNKELFEKIVNSQKEITEIYQVLTYDELSTVLEKWLHPENDNDETDEVAPSPDDEDEDEDEVNIPVKKQPSTKKSSNMTDTLSAFDNLFKGKK